MEFIGGYASTAWNNRENVVVDQMMYVQSLKLLQTLHAQRERERSESIEPDDAVAIADGAFPTVLFNERPAAQQYADYLTWLRGLNTTSCPPF
ncbi:MAG TPA: hypothetical protein VN649_02585 [Ramlibacter sp.]|nr:hypothetical protein [Ramlibacter sp.]